MRNLAALGIIALVLALGCNGEDDYASEEAETPELRAEYNSEEGAAALAESDRGVDEEGEKTWKQEALDYYDLRNPANRTFEMPRDWAIDLTKKLYAAGAEKVWVTRITAEDFGDGDVMNISDDLLIVLPQDPAKRKAIFALYNAEMEYEELSLADIGQKYIFLVAD